MLQLNCVRVKRVQLQLHACMHACVLVASSTRGVLHAVLLTLARAVRAPRHAMQMQLVFAETASSCPPWRQASSMLSRWLPSAVEIGRAHV